jgi:hypothetical protein
MEISRRLFASWLASGIVAAALKPTRAAPPKVGQVATRCWIPQQLDKVNRQFNSRSWHFARDNISNFRIAFPNWYAIGGNINPNGTERGTGGPATVFASIEYPSNMFTRVMWGGSASAVAGDGETILSDVIKLSIPKGAKFFVRFFVSSEVGVPTAVGIIQDSPRGDSVSFAPSGLVDLTMGGIIANSRGGNGFTPAAIVAQTQLPSVAIIGDSIAYGAFDSFDASGDIGILARAVGPLFAYINLACGNDRADRFVSNNSRRVALANYTSTIIIQYGVNDLMGGRSAEQLLEDRATIAGLFKDKTVIETTITPLAKSTDYFRTGLNQSLRLSPSQEANRVTFNAAARAGRVGFSHCADAAGAVERDGLFRALPDITADGIHLRREGYLMAAKSFDPSWVK